MPRAGRLKKGCIKARVVCVLYDVLSYVFCYMLCYMFYCILHIALNLVVSARGVLTGNVLAPGAALLICVGLYQHRYLL